MSTPQGSRPIAGIVIALILALLLLIALSGCNHMHAAFGGCHVQHLAWYDKDPKTGATIGTRTIAIRVCY